MTLRFVGIISYMSQLECQADEYCNGMRQVKPGRGIGHPGFSVDILLINVNGIPVRRMHFTLFCDRTAPCA